MRTNIVLNSSFRYARAFLIGLASLAAGGSNALAQESSLISREVPVVYDSGYAANVTDQDQVVIAFPVQSTGASWLRLQFNSVELSGDPDTGSGSIVRVTSLYDADAQLMNATGVAQWSNTSCYLNGDQVLVEVIAKPHTGRNRIVMKSVIASSTSS